MGIKVRKGLTTPLKIFGMYQGYFYAWAGGSGVCLLLLGLSFNGFIKDGVGGFIKFLGLVMLMALLSLSVKVYFTSKSSRKRLQFGTSEVSLSNRDLLRIRQRR